MLKKALPSEVELKCGQWIEFEDSNGPGYAQPDLFLILRSRIVLFECKLTETRRGYDQLETLYSPLLEEIFLRPVVRILACKNLARLDLRNGRSFSRWEVEGIRSALLSQETGRSLTWHWREQWA